MVKAFIYFHFTCIYKQVNNQYIQSMKTSSRYYDMKKFNVNGLLNDSLLYRFTARCWLKNKTF